MFKWIAYFITIKQRNGAFDKETPSLLQGSSKRQCHLKLKGLIKGKGEGGRSSALADPPGYAPANPE